MDSETNKNNRKENNQTKKDFENSVKFKDFVITFDRAEKGYNATYTNDGFVFKTNEGFPYVLKNITRKVYGSGIIGFFCRLIGAYETEMVEGFVCEDHKGKMIDFISKDYGEINYTIFENKLAYYPHITIKYKPNVSEKMRTHKFAFKSQEEYNFYFDYIYTKVK